MQLTEGLLFDNRYTLVRLIGRGGFSEVWLAQDKITELSIALKIYAPGQGMDNDGLNIFSQELKSVFHLSHANLLKPNHMGTWHNQPYLIMEYCSRGSITKQVGKMSEQEVWKVLHDVAAGLAYLHENEIVHQDIKPDNILLDDNGNYRITDFGISTKARTTLRKSVGGSAVSGGTTAYMAPERFSAEPAPTKASDIWALGATLYELIEGDVPFGEMGGGLQKGGAEIPKMKTSISSKLKNIIFQMLDTKPWNRPTAKQILEEINSPHLGRTRIQKNNKKLWKYVGGILAVLLIAASIFIWDYSRLKVSYYKDYTEVFGVPKGIGRVSRSSVAHMNRVYRFESKNYLIRRVSHVNSNGYTISDNETERKERPADMLLIYKDRKINKIRVLDVNGKVLYVKVFNEARNVVEFLYDDEYGTERVLNNSTIGLSNAITDGDSKGRISRWLLEYNKDGYVERLWYASYHNVKVPDADGIYGRSYTYDNDGHIIKEQYLSLDGTCTATNWGLGQKVFTYLNNNLVQVKYLALNGDFSYDSAGGCSIYEIDYDDLGNKTYAWYKDASGELTIPSNYKIAGTKLEYNSNGYLIKSTSLDTERQPFYANGAVSKLMSYDNYGFVNSIEFLDENGNATNSTAGMSKITFTKDVHSNVIEMWCYGLDMQLIEISNGYAGCKYKYDSNGNEIEEIYYGADKNVIELKDNTIGRRFEYDNLNRIVKVINIGRTLTTKKDNCGVAVYSYEMDARGNYTKLSYLDEEGKLVVNTDNQVAIIRSAYDENGNIIERSYFDNHDKLCEIQSNVVFAKATYKYDNNGFLVQSRFYDKSGNLTVYDKDDEHVVGYDYKRDNRGNAIETKGIDKDGILAQGMLCIRRTFDNHDNVTGTAFFDKDGNKDVNYEGIHRYKYLYDIRNQVIEEQCYDKTGQLVLGNNSKYAIKRNTYDNRGLQIRCDYYGTNEKLCKMSYGFASWQKEYNSLGQETHISYYDINGNPTNESDHIPEYQYQYDKWGNWISSTAYDGHGSIMMLKDEGYAIYRSEYDIRGNLLWSAYYDANNNPIKAKHTQYHKVTYSYNKYGSVTEQAYWGVHLEPISVNGIHKIRTTYTTNGKIQEESYFGISNEKINNDYGYHRIFIEYNENGQQVHRVYYTAKEQVYATQDWRAGEWTTKINNRIQIQNYISSQRAYLPLDYGQEFGNFTVSSFSILGDNCMGVNCYVPYTYSSLSSDNISYFRELLKELVQNISNDLPRGVSVKGILKDYYSNQITSYVY